MGEHYVRLASPLDACTPLGSNAGAILLAYRGNCTFWEKALIAAESGAKGLVVINNSTFPPTECLYLATDTNRTDSELAPLAGMFVASATGEQGSSLVNLTMSESVDPLASFSLLKLPKLDPAALLLLSLAVLTIGIAAAWTGMEFKEMLAQQEQPQQDGIAQQESPDNSVPTTFDRGAARSCLNWHCTVLSTDCAFACCFESCLRSCFLCWQAAININAKQVASLRYHIIVSHTV